MSRYIDADEFYVSQVARCWGEPIIGTCTSDNALLYDELQKSPTSDVVEVKYGEWQKHYKSGTTVSDGFVSSCCDMWNERKTSYCPHCGAKMDEGKERRGMTDKKLTDEEIIKRLERCVKRGNRNYDTDIVIDLINRQKAEIEELKNYVNRCKRARNIGLNVCLKNQTKQSKSLRINWKKNVEYLLLLVLIG